MSYTFVCIASSDLVIGGSFEFKSAPLRIMIDLHRENPGEHFLSPSLANYSLLREDPSAFPADYAFWRDQCESFMAPARRVLLLPLPGWEKSTGVRAELEHAIKTGKQVAVDVLRPYYRDQDWTAAHQFIKELKC